MIKIMFVCHGNICRSPMAEYIFKYITNNDKKYQVISRATTYEEIGNSIYYEAKKVLDKHGIPYNERSAKRLTIEEYNEYDYIIIMDEENRWGLNRIIHTNDKVYKLLEFCGGDDISDPWYTRRFEDCYQEIYNGCLALKKYLEKNN